MSKFNPDKINFKELFLTLCELPPEYRVIVVRLLVYMEHVNDSKFEENKYNNSMKQAKDRAGLTIRDICKIIGKKYNYSDEYSIDSLRETIKSAINRTSRKSVYFNDILEILNTNEFELEILSDAYNEEGRSDNLLWLYNTLTERNKYVIHYLINDLLCLSEIQKEEVKEDFEENDEIIEE